MNLSDGGLSSIARVLLFFFYIHLLKMCTPDTTLTLILQIN